MGNIAALPVAKAARASASFQPAAGVDDLVLGQHAEVLGGSRVDGQELELGGLEVLLTNYPPACSVIDQMNFHGSKPSA